MNHYMNLSEAAAALEQAMHTHPLVKEWEMPMPDNLLYSDPWILREIDPVNVRYARKDLEVGIGIFSKEGSARVVLRFTHSSWSAWQLVVNPVQLSKALNAAIMMAEFMWNNHLGITSEGAVPSSYIEIDA